MYTAERDMITDHRNIKTIKRNIITEIRNVPTEKRNIITSKRYITTTIRNIDTSIKERKTSYKKTLLLTWVSQDAGLKATLGRFSQVEDFFHARSSVLVVPHLAKPFPVGRNINQTLCKKTTKLI